MILHPGTPIDRYVVQEVLGRGGMATVYRVKHAVLGTQHALKVLHDNRSSTHDDLLREGRLQARLDPEFVIPVHDVLTVNGAPALLMPLVVGCSLRDVLQTYQPTESEIVSLFSAIASGVATAHDQDIVHRDLKPANVLLDIHRGQVRIRVADFGLGARANLEGMYSGFSGTPAYAPPEQLGQDPTPSKAQDLWALGVMLVECLTGKRPYTAASILEYREAIAHRAPDIEAVPQHWRALATSLLDPSKDTRGPSAKSLPQHLRQIHPSDPLEQGRGLANAIRRSRVVATFQPDAFDALPANRSSESLETFQVIDQEPQHHLPASLDTFIDRPKAISVIMQRIKDGARLMTLLGIGGTGKTRLALEFARQHLDDWPGGVCFCDLSDAADENQVVSAVGRAFGVPFTGTEPLKQVASAAAGRGRSLLIIDNAEQIIEPVRQLVEACIAASAELVILVTSRIVLGAHEEWTWSVPPLTTPEARALFLTRARRAKASYSPNDEELGLIDELIGQLDHLPLAIELAASRVRMMSPAKMLDRISERFRLLASRGGDVTRHRTLRAALDWSWDLLNEWERSALAQCSVFEGGFDLEAAEAVLDLAAFTDAPWPMDAIQSLVDKSLLRPTTDDRFSMLKSVHAYATERAVALGVQEDAARRHAEYYASFGHFEALSSLYVFGGTERRAGLVRELDNISVAWRRSVDHGWQNEACFHFLAVAEIVQATGPAKTLYDMARSMINISADSPHPQGHVWRRIGDTHMMRGELREARRWYEQTIALGPNQAADPVVARAHGRLALLCTREGNYRAAEENYLAALHLLTKANDEAARGNTLSNLGGIYLELGDYEKAEDIFKQGLLIHRTVGNQTSEGITLGNLGLIAKDQGHFHEAKTLYLEAIHLNYTTGNRISRGIHLVNLAALLRIEGKVDQAIDHYQQAIAILKRVGHSRFEAYSHLGLAEIYAHAGDLPQALKCISIIEALTHGQYPFIRRRVAIVKARVAVRQHDTPRALRLLSETDANSLNDGFQKEICLYLACKAYILVQCSQPESARNALMDAEHIRDTNAFKAPEILQAISEARAALGLPPQEAN